MRENRRRGIAAPLLEALLLLYEYKGREEAKRDIQKFLSTSKRRFKQGRRELRELRETMQRWKKKKGKEKWSGAGILLSAAQNAPEIRSRTTQPDPTWSEGPLSASLA